MLSTIPFDQAASRRHPVGCPRRRFSCCILIRTRDIIRCRCREIRGGLGGFEVMVFWGSGQGKSQTAAAQVLAPEPPAGVCVWLVLCQLLIGLLSSRVPHRICSGGLLAAVGAEPYLPPSWHCSTLFLSCSPCTRVDYLSRSIAAQGVHCEVATVRVQPNQGLQQLSRSSAKASACCSLSCQHAVCRRFASAVVVAQCINQFVPG